VVKTENRLQVGPKLKIVKQENSMCISLASHLDDVKSTGLFSNIQSNATQYLYTVSFSEMTNDKMCRAASGTKHPNHSLTYIAFAVLCNNH